MSEKIAESVRQKVIQFLPAAIAFALRSYREFAEQELSDGEAKTFSAHHAACKAAIAHVELLVKLAKWADLPEAAKGSPVGEDIAVMMASAQEELARYKSKSTQESEKGNE